MKLKVLLLALAAMLVVATGATAKNGGNGKSHAQTTHSHSAANGSKHEAKGQTTKTKVKKPKKHDAATAEEAGDELAPDVEVEVEEPSAEKTNPAWTCKARLEERGAEQFVSDYGTNTNGANAFGKCVSGVANGSEEETTEAPGEADAACEAVAPAPDVVETTEVPAADEDSSDTTEVPAADEDSSDTTEVPACEPVVDGNDTTTPSAADGTGDTTGTVTETVSDPAVPSADDALLAAARAVKAFAASL
jgi:hypothetical protein